MPRIGLLSDSHGRAPTTREAVSLLLEQGVDLLLHLGDVGTVEVIDALVVERPSDGELIEAHVVFGNTDWDRESLARYAQGLGVVVDHPIGRLTFDGQVLAFCHGHETAVMDQALAEPVKWLCHGHSHRMADQQRGATRIINPGALFRASRYTVAVLDTASDELAFHTVGGQSPLL